MKKWGIIFILALGVAIAIANKIPLIHQDIDAPEESYDSQISQVAAVPTARPETMSNMQQKKITPDQVYQGNLLLVNAEYSLQENAEQQDIVQLSMHPDLVEGYALFDRTIRISKNVAYQLNKMITAASEDGVNHFLLSSGYRDLDEQKKLYKDMGASYALPAGSSEHNLGLSVDMGSTQKKMEDAPEGKWLAKHSAEYGFILRYPKNKVDVTGIEFEPWHFRYVGLPHSLIMQKNEWVLEEYLDELQAKKQITFELKGKKYQINYYPYSRNLTVPVPKDREYEVSGDNRGGVIVTIGQSNS
ncbi:D-alanyl-D-alanine carboxypeptidase family protein [Paenibacillus albiflavus]|uniref:D-alanyl-D-alanine carboxypeptidase family protein n=1 Tax=Paenibacillus albiflavus TaxID=2545760 RepID=A0A4R4EJ72_9BACL|nr:M15 family metallopeptidase [Paenibacillus albiflavus]TCZ78288.1 D-alanyl-D-alanine carboxypeptidase family protein [Paenibacillus albiflavus]